MKTKTIKVTVENLTKIVKLLTKSSVGHDLTINSNNSFNLYIGIGYPAPLFVPEGFYITVSKIRYYVHQCKLKTK